MGPHRSSLQKKHGSPWLCVYYWNLDDVTIPDSYTTPRIDYCINSIGDSTIHSALDAKWGYWKIPTAQEYRDKTNFVSHRGTFRWLRMPLGLRNAAATLQQSKAWTSFFPACDSRPT